MAPNFSAGSQTKRACDQCRRRKIRCNGLGPESSRSCPTCVEINCPCTYEQPILKRGPRKNTGQVISELQLQSVTYLRRRQHLQEQGQDQEHETQHEQEEEQADALLQINPQENSLQIDSSHSLDIMSLLNALGVSMPRNFRNRRDSCSMMTDFTNQHHDNNHTLVDMLYPRPLTMKTVDIQYVLCPVDTPNPIYCLTSSLMAYSLISANCSDDILPKATSRCTLWVNNLLSEASDLLNGPEANLLPLTPPDSSTLLATSEAAVSSSSKVIPVITFFVLYHCHLSLNCISKAWLCLCQSTMLAWAAGMHQTSFYNGIEEEEREKLLSLYRLLFVTQSAQALESHFIPTLPRNPKLLEHDSSAGVATDELYLSLPSYSLRLLTKLYLAGSEDLFTWTNTNDSQPVNELALIDIHERIQQAYSIPHGCDGFSALDLKCTQLWLEVIVWEVAFQRGLLSFTPTSDVLSFDFPIKVAQEIVSRFETWSTPIKYPSAEGLCRKIFRIACNCLDIFPCISISQGSTDWQLNTLLGSLKRILLLLYGEKPGPCAEQLESKAFVAGLSSLA